MSSENMNGLMCILVAAVLLGLGFWIEKKMKGK